MAKGTKVVKQIFLHKCSSLTIISRVTFIIISFKAESVNFLPNLLHFIIITCQKAGQTFFITIKFVKSKSPDKSVNILRPKGAFKVKKKIIFHHLITGFQLPKIARYW